MSIYIRNPHSILAILETRPQDVLEVQLPERPAASWREIAAAADQIGVKLATGDQDQPRRGRRGKRPNESGRREGPGAFVKERSALSLDTLLPSLAEGQTPEGLYLALDTVQDPQNLGSIFRTAAFFGVAGMILTRDRSAPLSAVVYDVASGGLEHVPFSLQTNLSRALDEVRDRGLWILGTSEHADMGLEDLEPDRPWLLVLGNEESGLRRLTLEKCDAVCRIPSLGPLPSLNVSVAAGIFIQKLTARPPERTS